MSFAPHPVSDIFPMMSGTEIRSLADDIRENGQAEPIWLHADGRVIDGRNRWRACELAEVEPLTVTYEGDEDALVAFVVSLNLKRRHLNEAQRAIVAARISTLELGANQHSGNVEGRPIGRPSAPDAPITQARAGEMLNVGSGSVHRARKVIKRAVLEVISAVEAGDMSVAAASKIADHPAEEQREMVTERATRAPRTQVDLPHRFMQAIIELDAVTKKFERLRGDRQFRHNASLMSDKYTGDIIRASEKLAALLADLGN